MNCSQLITDPCGKRGITWTKTPGYAIDKYDDKTINNVLTATRCRQLCLSEKSFLCRSVEYLAGMGKCVLSKSKRGDVMPAYFIRWPGYVYQEWSCKTGKREGPPQFGGMEKGGDWLASKGFGITGIF